MKRTILIVVMTILLSASVMASDWKINDIVSSNVKIGNQQVTDFNGNMVGVAIMMGMKGNFKFMIQMMDKDCTLEKNVKDKKFDLKVNGQYVNMKGVCITKGESKGVTTWMVSSSNANTFILVELARSKDLSIEYMTDDIVNITSSGFDEVYGQLMPEVNHQAGAL